MSTEHFACTVCGDKFTVPQDALDRYPHWRPKFCRAHSPTRDKATQNGKSGGASPARRPQGEAAIRTAPKKRRARSARGAVEQNHTTSEVLEKFHDGPTTGVFTDGGCTPNPGRGGWGMVWVKDNVIVEQRHGKDPDTTNNRMELQAIIEALKVLDTTSTETIYTDSKLCVDTLNTWAKGWERNGWKRKTGAIKNLELVQEAYALRTARPQVTLQHIKAHVGYRWNEYADSLATAWMRETI